jgi:hypothetical protein
MGSDYTFSFTSAALDCANAADYFEPNNATNETTEVEIPCTFPVLSSCGGDERKDYYSFTLGEAKKVTVRLRRIDGGSAASWSTSLLRGFYQIYAFGDSLRTTEETSNYYTFLPGTYTFSTGKQNEDDDIVFYSLTIETSSPCPDDVYEDNDFYFEATAIDPGSYTDLMSCYRDQDFYAIDVSAGQTLTVTADNLSGLTFDGGVYIWDPDDAFAVKDTGTHDPLSASWTAAVGGTYTFSVAWHLGEVEYSMVVEVE